VTSAVAANRIIQLKVGNVFTDVVGDLPEAFFKQLQKKMSFRPEGYKFSTGYNRWVRNADGKPVRRVWDGWKRQIWRNTKRTYFPTGLYSLAKETLNEFQLPYQMFDFRVKHLPTFEGLHLAETLTLRDYQERITYESCDRSRGIIQAPTGSGKTIIGAGIIANLRVKPFIFFVTSIDLLMQTKTAFEEVLRINGGPCPIGQIGGGVVDIQDINIATVQTVVRALGHKWDKKTKFDRYDPDDKTDIELKRDEIMSCLENAQGCICDEVQHWRADTCQLVARSLPNAYYSYGCSATPYRDEGDDLMIQACFGRDIVKLTASELIDKGYLIKPTIFNIHIRPPKTKFKTFQQIYKEQVVQSDFYNQRVASVANRFIEQGRLVLLLVQQIAHGERLQKDIPGSIFLCGDNSKKVRLESIDKLRQREISCIISTSLFDEGIDIRPLDCVILAGQGKSRVRAMQRIGRIMRLFQEGNYRKTKATAVDFCIHQKYLQGHNRERVKMYRTEPSFDVKDVKEDD